MTEEQAVRFKAEADAREIRKTAKQTVKRRNLAFKLTRREVETVNAHITTGIVKVLPEKLSKWEFVKGLSNVEKAELFDQPDVGEVRADEVCKELFVDEPEMSLSEPEGGFRESELVNQLRSQVWERLLREGLGRPLDTLRFNSLGRSAARDWLRAYGVNNKTGVYKDQIIGLSNTETTVLDDGDHESNETVTDSWDIIRLETSGFFSQGDTGLEDEIQRWADEWEHHLRLEAMDALKAANVGDYTFIRAYYLNKTKTTAIERNRVQRIKDWLRERFPDAFCIRKIRKERGDRKGI
jgi:hypothetical protein